MWGPELHGWAKDIWEMRRCEVWVVPRRKVWAVPSHGDLGGHGLGSTTGRRLVGGEQCVWCSGGIWNRHGMARRQRCDAVTTGHVRWQHGKAKCKWCLSPIHRRSAEHCQPMGTHGKTHKNPRGLCGLAHCNPYPTHAYPYP